MKATLKWGSLGLLVLIIVGAAVVVGGSYLEHRRLVAEERQAYPPPGRMVPVAETDDSALHVYAEGAGDPTLVFLAGFGTSAPVYDFQALYKELSRDHRIAVVERAGYGWSEIGDRPRDLATVLSETRTALQEAGEAPPYVLFPHSMAGLEAVYWAQRHPDEVAAIIGLDPLVPGYDVTEDDAAPSRPITLLARTGLMRSGPDVFETNFPAMIEGRLSQEEAAAAKSLFMRRTNTPDMWAEARSLAENAALLEESPLPEAPFHAFVSEDQPEAWTEAVTAYAAATGGETVTLDAGHYLHVERPELIAERSRELIQATATN